MRGGRAADWAVAVVGADQLGSVVGIAAVDDADCGRSAVAVTTVFTVYRFDVHIYFLLFVGNTLIAHATLNCNTLFLPCLAAEALVLYKQRARDACHGLASY